MAARHKISTTVSAQTHAHLQRLVKSGKAHTLAQALDMSMKRLRTFEMRARLEHDTAAYFEQLPSEVQAVDAHLESALGQTADEVDFDGY